MMVSQALLVLALVVGAHAAPHGGDAAVCSTECPVAGSPKLFYQPGKTYNYEYSGKSKVQLKGVEGGLSETDWSAHVELSWITPCDMVISIKDPKGNDAEGPDAARFLERYPLVVAVADGRVQHVCSHPDDDTWAINLKKGVASAFQNSLPSNSTLNSGQNITETDVVGTCPTRYEVQNQGDRVIMTKEKNHRLCKHRYPTPAETQVPWLKGPLPLEESSCMCKQEIKNGIYSTITCEDKNVIRPSYGVYKYVEARQESTLRFLSESSEQSAAASAIPQGNMVRRSLRYDYDTLKKDPSMVAQLDQTMSQICEKTKDAVERDVAALVAKVLRILRRVPEEAVAQTLDKIRSGQFCQDHKKLEGLFLDAVAFVHESGAVKVMVKELTSGHASVDRRALYTAALYLLPRPCIHAMMALKPLFESTHNLPMPTLAAASMVNTYCRHNHNCHEEAPVKSLAEALGNKLQRQCSPSDDEETEKAALTTLKALGNMGVMTQEVAKSVLRCMETEGVKNSIRVAAAQAFRQAKCYRSSTDQLVNFAVDPAKETEVRIASYLVAVRCAKQNDFDKIVGKISTEQNTQVRGFIFSHILNLQQSDAPEKENIRYLLANIVVPRNFNRDIRKYSRNIDLSYFSPSLGAGAGVESNIIYSPGSFVPRSVDFNLTAALAGISINLGEIGARLEGLEPAIEKLFGPEGYFQKTNFGQILNDMSRFVGENRNKILENFHRGGRQKRSIDMSLLSTLFHKLYSGESRVAKADVFARFLGQEISFASLAGDLTDISADKIIENFFSYFDDILPRIKNLNINSARTAQMNFDYSFPTIQGVPLKLKMEGTTVVGLKMKGNLNLVDILSSMKSGENTIKVIPSLSIQANGFVGFDAYLGKTGIKTSTNISSSNGLSLSVKAKNNNELEVQWDLPEKMELINVRSETYLTKKVRGSPDTKITPPSMRDTRMRTQSCINSLEPVLGLKFCYELDIPDIFRSNSLPLGAPAIAKLYIEKEESSMKGYLMTIATQNKKGSKMMVVKVETSGSSTPREAEATMSHTLQGDSSVISARLQSSAATSGVWFNVINGQDHKGVQAHFKHKSDQNEISRGIKVDLKTRTTSSEKEYQFEVFSSRNRNFPTESQIFESKFVTKMNGREISLDWLSRTKNTLRNYFDWNFEIGTDLRRTPHSFIPVPSKLRKFEFRCGLVDWKIESLIQQTRQSGQNSAFSSAFKIGRRNEELFSFEATHTTQGRLYQDFVAKTAAQVKLDRLEYKASCDVHCGRNVKGATLEVNSPRGNEKIVDLKALYEYSGESLRATFEVDIPRYMRTIKFESKAAGHGQDRYMLEAALKHGDRVLLHAQGPVTAKLSPMTELQADIMFNTLNSGHHRFSSIVKLTPHEQILSFELKNEQESIFAVEWDVKVDTSKKASMIFKVQLLSLLKCEVDATMSQRSVRINFDTLLFAKSSSPNRVKGYTDIDIQQKKIQVDILLDADRNANKKVSGECSLMSSSSSPGHASLRGHIVWISKLFPFTLDVTTTNPLAHSRVDNGFKLEVGTPSKKTLKLEVVNKMELQRNAYKTDTRVRYNNLQNQDYKFTNVMDVENLGDPWSYKLDYQMSFTSPQGQETAVSVDAKHQRSQHERIIYSKVSASTPSKRKPLQVEFQSSSKDNSYNIHWKADLDAPATMFKWDMETHQEGGVRSFDSAIDMTAIRDLIKTALSMVGGRGEGNRNGWDEHRDRGGNQRREEDYDSNRDDLMKTGGNQRREEDYDSNRDDLRKTGGNQRREEDYDSNRDDLRKTGGNQRGEEDYDSNRDDLRKTGGNQRGEEDYDSNRDDLMKTGGNQRREEDYDSNRDDLMKTGGNQRREEDYDSNRDDLRKTGGNQRGEEDYDSNRDDLRKTGGNQRGEEDYDSNRDDLRKTGGNQRREEDYDSNRDDLRKTGGNQRGEEDYDSNRDDLRKTGSNQRREEDYDSNRDDLRKTGGNQRREEDYDSNRDDLRKTGGNQRREEDYDSNRDDLRKTGGNQRREEDYDSNRDDLRKTGGNQRREEDYDNNRDEHHDRQSHHRRKREANSNDRNEHWSGATYQRRQEEYDHNRDDLRSRGGNRRREGEDYENDRDEHHDRQSHHRRKREANSNDRNEHWSGATYQGRQGVDYDSNMGEHRGRDTNLRSQGVDYDSNMGEHRGRDTNLRSQGVDYDSNMGEHHGRDTNLRSQGVDYDSNMGEHHGRDTNLRSQGVDYDSNMGEHHGRETYRYRYQNPTPNTYSMVFKTPSRTMEGEAEYSPSQSSLRFYPNRDQSEAKYEVAAMSSHSDWDQQSKYEGRISHPGLRDMRVEVQHSGSGESFRGSIELDIFPGTQDKITGALQSTMTAENTFQIQASLHSRALKVSPKITIMVAYAPHTAGIDVQFQKSPSSPVIFQVSAIYDRISHRDATVAFRVINDRVPVVDIAGVVEGEEDPECNGLKVKAKAHISPLGTYDIHSKLCRPVFIELRTNKHGSEKVYVTKLGFQSPNNIEASLSMGDNDQNVEHALVMARARLASSVRVKIDAAYKEEEFRGVKDAVKEECERGREALASWGKDVYRYLQQQAQQQGVPFPDPQVLALVTEAKRDLRQLYQTIIYDVALPRYEELRELFHDRRVSTILWICSGFWSGMASFQNDLRTRLAQEVVAWQRDFRGFMELVMNVVTQFTRVVERGEMPEAIRRLLETTKIFKALKSDLDAIMQRYPQESEAVWQVLAKAGTTLRQDFYKLREKLMQIHTVERTISWIINNYNSDRLVRWEVDKFISRLLREATIISITTGDGHFSAEFPLHKPLYSLTQLLQEALPNPVKLFKNFIWSFDTYIPAPVQDVIWAYYTLFSRRRTVSPYRHVADLLPPYNRTAMVVSDTEILTFDGAVLRAPRSPCNVVLAAYKSNKLTMAHPQPSAPPQITLSTHSATVTIKPDFRVEVNGKEMNRQRQTEGEVTIQKTPREVNVTSPFMTVRVFRQERVVSVNVSGWTFGRLAGLLGTYDGEIANDWFTSSGRNATSLKELVASWQENKQCPTPDISPFNHNTVPADRLIECYSLLELRSRCYPLVNPAPFVKMCHAARQPCDAARAYRSVCAWKGVRDMFPIAC